MNESKISICELTIPSTTFELENIYLCNYNTNGRIAPIWDGFGALSFTAAKSPNLPASTATKIGSINAIKYEAAGLSSYLGEIYTFEANAADDANGYDHPDRKDAPCVIIEGKYKNAAETSFYRIDFTYAETGNGVEKGKYMPVLRNHLYEIDIVGVSDNGYPSIDEALDSYMVHSNMDFTSIVYDEGQIKDIVFNGRYMLGVDKGEFLFYSGKSYNETEEVSKLTINTDDPDGWKINISDDSNNTNPDWLKVTNMSGTQGTTRIGIMVDVSAPDKAQTGYLDITAGRLKKRVKYYSVDPLLDFTTLTDGDVIDFGIAKQEQLFTVKFITNAYWTYKASDNTGNNAFSNIIPNPSHPLLGKTNAGTAAQVVNQEFSFMPSNDDTPIAGTVFSTTLTFSTCNTGDFGNDQSHTLTFTRKVPAYVGLFDTDPIPNSQIPAKNAVVEIHATANTAWTGVAKYANTLVSSGATSVPAQPKTNGVSQVQVRENLDNVAKVINFYIKYTDTNGDVKETYVGDLIQEAKQ